MEHRTETPMRDEMQQDSGREQGKRDRENKEGTEENTRTKTRNMPHIKQKTTARKRERDRE